MNLLDRAKAKLGSDYATSKAAGVTRAYISNVRSELRPLSPDIAADIADAIGEDPIAAAVEALAAQAKTKEGAKKWQKRLEAYAVSSAKAQKEKTPAEARVSLTNKLVGAIGLEPTTPTMSR